MPTNKHADYVIIRGQVFRWEEKSPFVPSGKSVQGAIEYDREKELLRCHDCGEWYASLGKHARVHDGTREYKLRHGLRLSAGLITPAARKKMARRLPSRQGPPPRACTRKAGASAEFRNEHNVCPPQTILTIQRIAAENGCTPSIHDVPRKVGKAAQLHFGSWNAAVIKAGLRPNQQIRSSEMLIEGLRDFYVLNRRLPKVKEFGQDRLASYFSYVSHFGSLKQAIEEAGLGLVQRVALRKRLELDEQMHAGANAAD